MTLQPAFSPDGKGLAYASGAAGAGRAGAYRFHVLALANPSSRWEVSTTNGYPPRWSPATRELFFFHFQDRPGTLKGPGLSVASPSREGPVFLPGAVRPLAEGIRWSMQGAAPDGPSDPTHLVVINAFEDISRKTSTKAR